MTNEEIAGSLVVLETFAVSAFALSIAECSAGGPYEGITAIGAIT